MKRIMLSGKIHQAIVTQTDLHYEGSLGIDGALLDAAGFLPLEKVHIYNVTNGERFSTYLVREKENSGTVAVYGAAAHKARKKDMLIIVSYAIVDEEEIPFFKPKILILDEKNRITSIK